MPGRQSDTFFYIDLAKKTRFSNFIQISDCILLLLFYYYFVIVMIAESLAGRMCLE